MVGMRMPGPIRGFTRLFAGSQPRSLPSRAQCYSVASVKHHKNTPFVLPMLRIRFAAPPPALLKASIQTVGPTALPCLSFKHHDVCRILSWCSHLMAVCLLIGACTATACTATASHYQRQATVMQTDGISRWKSYIWRYTPPVAFLQSCADPLIQAGVRTDQDGKRN